jgi:23S rRNA pseudouridine1911/1915/1917 synthase
VPSPENLYSIPEECIGVRLDRALASHPEIKTRSRAEKLIADGRVTLSGKMVKASYKCRAGDCFAIDFPELKASTLEPWNFPLDILFEDPHLLVVNKPAGLVVHPSYGHHTQTLVHALLHHTRDLSIGFNQQRPGIVHRLDKETSGLLVVAKTDTAHEHLSQQFRARTVRRLYWALAHGKFDKPSGTQTTFLGRHPVDRKRFASGSIGKRAVTHYRVLGLSKAISHLECRLETGRTHQIRVHLSELGHPIIGDKLYGATPRLKTLPHSELKRSLLAMTRIGLHARELGFVHPVTSEQLFFSVDWPEDLKSIFTLWDPK